MDKHISKAYICRSPNHLFRTLIRTMQVEEGDACVLMSDDLKPLPLDILGKYIEKVYYYPNNKINMLWSENKSKHKLRLKEALISTVEVCMDMNDVDEALSSSDLVFYLDSEPFVVYLMMKYKGNKMILVEDGESIYVPPKSNLNSIIKRLIGYPLPYGQSARINELEVSFPERLKQKSLRKKAVELSTKTLLSRLSVEAKQDLLDFYKFDTDKNLSQVKDAVLLVTQPLAEDGIITEDEKWALYREIVETYKGDGELYIKAHPRELTDYRLVFPECKVIQNSFPAELFSLSGLVFNKALTLFSTAIHLIPSNEKVILGLNYNEKVANGWLAFTGKKQ